MAYTKTVWVNNQAPAINAENLNKIEDGIYNSVRYADAQTLTDAQKTQARANIAAAPDGFGLGANGYPNPYTVVTGATIDALNESGLFWYRDADTPIYPDNWNSGTIGNLLHIQGATNNTVAARQIFYPYHPSGDARTINISCMRMRTDDGEWQPWEWVNPPMTLGVEFRTTERYAGKPVYAQIINCGSMPAIGSEKNTSIAAFNVDVVTFISGWCTYYRSTIDPNIFGIALSATINDIRIKNLSREVNSNAVMYTLVKYTKTTD